MDLAPIREVAPHERTIVGGRYELLFELASGGMGTVFVGRRLGAGGFQRLVAIKRMHARIARDPDSSGAFQDEARIASLIQHANVVAIHDVYREGNEHLLVMDYIDGASLAALLASLRKQDRRLPTNIGLRIIYEALRGLHAAHELVGHDGKSLEVVHRDATPHNILIGTDGSVRLTDFGIARAVVRAVCTEPGYSKGKYAYMAPEQAFAEPLDRRADVFTMGIVAWEVVTGKRLFANRPILDVTRGVALGRIAAPSKECPSLPSMLDQVILRALEPWRENRYPTAAHFARAIEAFALREGGLAPPSAIAEALEIAQGPILAERKRKLRHFLAATVPDAAEHEFRMVEPSSPHLRPQPEVSQAATAPRSPPPPPPIAVAAQPSAAAASETENTRGAFRRRSRPIAAAMAIAMAFSAGIAFGRVLRNKNAVSVAERSGAHVLEAVQRLTASSR